MNAREKKLAIAIGGIAGLLVLAGGIRAVMVKPLQKIDKLTASSRDKLEKLKGERRAYFAAEDVVKGFVKRTFADQIDQASAKSGEVLTKQILQSGLRESDFSRLPVGPRRVGRSANEIGWSIQGQGKLSDVINLIYLLQESPYLHRIENLAVSQGDAPGHVRVGFRFLTLVLDRAPLVETTQLVSKASVEAPERRKYDGIAARDLLRPYVKRAPDKGEPSSRPAQSAPAGPAALRVVSLSEWGGQPEIHIRDQTNQKTAQYKPGDELAGGTIVMVDYRALPMPGKEALQSFSRVILKIDNEYWAIERGQTLADKYRLAPELLPPSLSKL